MTEVTIIFTFKGRELLIEGKTNEVLSEIFKRYCNIIEEDINNLSFVYKDERLNEYSKLEEINNTDKTINIAVHSYDENKKRAKYIICPTCNTNCIFSLDNYKICLSKCLNGHEQSNILLNEFERTQYIDESKILCDKCGNNKFKAYGNQFYHCCSCDQNLCTLCESRHTSGHNTLDYEAIPFKCNKHNGAKYNSYCTECKQNLCKLCESEHKEHKVVFFNDLVIKRDYTQLKVFKEKLDRLNDDIKDITNKFKIGRASCRERV